MTKETISARDEMLHIMRCIWGSRDKAKLDSCQNMINNYINKHGDSNIGVTLLDIEMARQTRLNGLFKNMGLVQDQLQKDNENKRKKAEQKKLN
jgi:hypothetical protein